MIKRPKFESAIGFIAAAVPVYMELSVGIETTVTLLTFVVADVLNPDGFAAWGG